MKLESETNCRVVNHSVVVKTSNQLKMRKKRKHIPHAERPLDAVQKRNERERQRVHEVNAAFLNLLNHLPQHHTVSCQLTMHEMTATVATTTSSSSKMSKINILRQAIAYIDNLSNILQSPSTSTETSSPPAMSNLFHHCDSNLDEINTNLLIKNHQEIDRIFSSQANVGELTELHNSMANCYSQVHKLEHWSSCMVTENIGFSQKNKFWNPPIDFFPNK